MQVSATGRYDVILNLLLPYFNNGTIAADYQRFEKVPFFQILLKIASNVCFNFIFSSDRNFNLILSGLRV